MLETIPPPPATPVGERVARLEARLDNQDKLILELRDDVKHMRSMMDQTRGGWKAIALFITLFSALGGAVGWLIGHFRLIGGGS